MELAKLYLVQSYESYHNFALIKNNKFVEEFNYYNSKIDSLIEHDYISHIGLIKKANSYQDNFQNYSKLIKQRGYNENEGLEGRFREVIHSVEDYLKVNNLKTLRADMLEIRRREKDFILRKSPKYISMVELNIDSIKARIESLILEEKQKSKIIEQIEVYRVSFLNLAKVELKSLETGQEIEKAYSKFKAGLDNNLATSSDQLDSILRTLSISLILIIITFIFYTFKVAINIIKPLEQLRDQIAAINVKSLHERVKVEAKDEIGDLANSFNNMIVHVQNAYDNIEESNRLLESRVKKRTKELTSQIEEKNIFQEKLESSFQNMSKMKEDLKYALDKEKELGELKSNFVSMVSHEYRTPLTVILTSTYLLKEAINKGDYQTFDRKLSLIQQSVERMTYLIEQTTIYNSIEKCKFEVRKNNFDLIKLIKSSIENFNIIKKENQKLVFDTQEKELLINTDDNLLRQSIDNLINNAIKYSPDNHDIKISVVKEFDDVILRVQDEGVGIPEKDQKKLFDAFHRSSNVNGIPGTGLGLSITKKFVESLGGRMRFSSKENQGSTFEIKLKT